MPAECQCVSTTCLTGTHCRKRPVGYFPHDRVNGISRYWLCLRCREHYRGIEAEEATTPSLLRVWVWVESDDVESVLAGWRARHIG